MNGLNDLPTGHCSAWIDLFLAQKKRFCRIHAEVRSFVSTTFRVFCMDVLSDLNVCTLPPHLFIGIILGERFERF